MIGMMGQANLAGQQALLGAKTQYQAESTRLAMEALRHRQERARHEQERTDRFDIAEMQQKSNLAAQGYNQQEIDWLSSDDPNAWAAAEESRRRREAGQSGSGGGMDEDAMSGLREAQRAGDHGDWIVNNLDQFIGLLKSGQITMSEAMNGLGQTHRWAIEQKLREAGISEDLLEG
jgi:hypothetical protein